MSDTPKMKTAASLTPEQIREIVARHQQLQRRRVVVGRTVLRVVFWSLVTVALFWFAAKTGALNDYENTCEALGKICDKP